MLIAAVKRSFTRNLINAISRRLLANYVEVVRFIKSINGVEVFI